jgi:hypothetical protein
MTTGEGVIVSLEGVGVSTSWGLSSSLSNPALSFSGVGVGGSFSLGTVTNPALAINGVGVSGSFAFAVMDTSGTVTILFFNGLGVGGSVGAAALAVDFSPSFFATYIQPAGESVSFGSVMGQSVSFGSVAGESVS